MLMMRVGINNKGQQLFNNDGDRWQWWQSYSSACWTFWTKTQYIKIRNGCRIPCLCWYATRNQIFILGLVFIACVVFQGLWSTLSNWPKWEHLQNNGVLVAKSASSFSDLWSDRKTPSKATAQVSWLCYIKSWQMSTSHLIYWPKNLKIWSMVLIGGTWKT